MVFYKDDVEAVLQFVFAVGNLGTIWFFATISPSVWGRRRNGALSKTTQFCKSLHESPESKKLLHFFASLSYCGFIDVHNRKHSEKSILLVEDKANVRQPIGQALRILGCTVYEAANGRDACTCPGHRNYHSSRNRPPVPGAWAVTAPGTYRA